MNTPSQNDLRQFTMPHYIIGFCNEDGSWFLERPGMWSDACSDARRFLNKSDAEKIAGEAAARLNRRTDQWHPQSRVRVIEMRQL